jgi:hypothetical protein
LLASPGGASLGRSLLRLSSAPRALSGGTPLIDAKHALPAATNARAPTCLPCTVNTFDNVKIVNAHITLSNVLTATMNTRRQAPTVPSSSHALLLANSKSCRNNGPNGSNAAHRASTRFSTMPEILFLLHALLTGFRPVSNTPFTLTDRETTGLEGRGLATRCEVAVGGGETFVW